MEREVNVKLNLLKGFACIGVVFIHITFPGLFGQVVLYASAYAVPIFFMIAGYYAIGKNDSVIKRRLIKIIKIFIYAYVLFFLYSSAFAIKEHELSVWIAQNCTWKTLVKFICFCTIDFAIPLWYLIAMIEVYIVWMVVVKYGKENKLVKTFPILFILQVILTSYCETTGLEWFWKVNFLTRGMPWFLLGYYLHTDKAKKIREIDSYKLIVLVLVGCIIAVVPTAFSLPFKFNVIGYIPYAFGLFTLALKNSSQSVCKPIEIIGEKLSLNIYIFHVLMSGVLEFVLSHIFRIDTESAVYLWIRPIAVVISTICASWVIYICLGKFKKIKARHGT